MPSPAIELRDETYTRILLKRGLAGFSFNSFQLTKTWRPRMNLQTLATLSEGIVYVIAGPIGDKIVKNRNNVVLGEYAVKIGYQCHILDPDSLTTVDPLVNFVDELHNLCQHEINHATLKFAFNRIEPERDENGIPYSYIFLDEVSTFEAYFNAYYQIVIP